MSARTQRYVRKRRSIITSFEGEVKARMGSTARTRYQLEQAKVQENSSQNCAISQEKGSLHIEIGRSIRHIQRSQKDESRIDELTRARHIALKHLIQIRRRK